MDSNTPLQVDEVNNDHVDAAIRDVVKNENSFIEVKVNQLLNVMVKIKHSITLSLMENDGAMATYKSPVVVLKVVKLMPAMVIN